MNKFKLILYLLLFSAFIFSNIQAITIDGKVTNSQTGSGIAEASVSALKLWEGGLDSLHTAFTNNLGEFQIELNEPGVYFFNVFHTDYKFAEFGPFNINTDSTLNFTLNPKQHPNHLRIMGFVLNELNNFPISNAQVKLLTPDGTLINSSTANFRGKYFFENVEIGTYLLTADAEGYLANIDTIYVSNSAFSNHFNIYLTPENGGGNASLTGLVYFVAENDSSEIPIPGAVISLNHHILALNFETTSNEYGEYEFAQIPAGQYFLHAEANGFIHASYTGTLNIEPGENSFDILMSQIHPPLSGGISGRVVFDSTNIPVSGVRISFLPTAGGPNFFVQPTAITDSAGYYEYQLPAWDYYVMLEYYAYPAMHHPYIEFYDDVQIFSQATPVDVLDNQITTGINFGIPEPVSNSAIVSGVVTDNAGLPLNEAMVKLIFRGHNAGHYYNNLHTLTNQNGEYSITIDNVSPFNNKFIALAKKEGFKKEFYDNQPEIFLADVITINATGDTTITGIDFSLDSINMQEKFSISGIVSDSSGTGLAGTFVAAFGFRNWQFGFAFTGTDGSYSIPNLKLGIYYVLFFKPGYAPQFYDRALLWEDADPILLQSDVSGINAVLNEISFGNQPGVISGNITAEDNSPLSGVMVSILNQNDYVLTYAMTDASGNYNLEGLGTGNYKLYASKVNYQSQTKLISFDLANGNSTDINLTLPNSVTETDDDINETPADYSLGNNYPNPFNPSTTITFSLPEAANVKLTVFNAIGQEVAELVKDNLEAGNHSITFNAENINSGIYFYKLQTEKFVSVKKMILLK